MKPVISWFVSLVFMVPVLVLAQAPPPVQPSTKFDIPLAEGDGLAVQGLTIGGERAPLRRDPFAMTPYMQESYHNLSSGRGLQFTASAQIKVPPLALKGLIRKSDTDVVALLEIKGAGIHVVREGDTVGFNKGDSELVLRIKKIDRLSVLVEAGNLGKVIVVR